MYIRMDDAWKQNVGIDEATVLPWGEVEVPEIPPGKYGKWEIIEKTPPVLRGYFKGLQTVKRRNPVLLRDGQVWMSLTPMELESMSPYVHGASGKVTVVGGGLGVYLFNVLKKTDVTSVTLVERDRDILDLLVNRMHMLSWPGAEKLTVIEEDILKVDRQEMKYMTVFRPRFLYVDIWTSMNAPTAVPETQIIQSMIDAETVAFWTQELAFIHWCGEQGRKPPPTSEDWRDWTLSHGLPVYEYEDAPVWSYRAAMQVINY